MRRQKNSRKSRMVETAEMGRRACPKTSQLTWSLRAFTASWCSLSLDWNFSRNSVVTCHGGGKQPVWPFASPRRRRWPRRRRQTLPSEPDWPPPSPTEASAFACSSTWAPPLSSGWSPRSLSCRQVGHKFTADGRVSWIGHSGAMWQWSVAPTCCHCTEPPSPPEDAGNCSIRQKKRERGKNQSKLIKK